MKKFITVTSIVVLAIVLATMLMACTPSEESLKKKYEEADYTVTSVNSDEAQKYLDDYLGEDSEEIPVKYVLVVTDGIAGINVVPVCVVICFKNSDDAKAAYEGNEDSANVKKKGNAVAFGTEKALELF